MKRTRRFLFAALVAAPFAVAAGRPRVLGWRETTERFIMENRLRLAAVLASRFK